jgi:hypothetical protein
MKHREHIQRNKALNQLLSHKHNEITLGNTNSENNHLLYSLRVFLHKKNNTKLALLFQVNTKHPILSQYNNKRNTQDCSGFS